MANQETNQLKELGNKLKLGWTSLSTVKKIVISSVLGIAIVGLTVYGLFFSGENFVPLYTGLDITTAGEIRAELESRGESHEIGAGGSSILVPSSQVDRLRMELAVDGLTPESGVGFELFDDAPVGMSERDHQIMRQRALEGELERSINSLAQVEESRVHLNLNTDSIFSRETSPSSASIMLRLRNNQMLNDDQVEGIMSLVASAIDNLPVENIAIIDENGNLLSRGVGTTNGTVQSTEISERQLAYSRELEQRIQAQLGQPFGHGNIAVSVNVNLDASSQVTRTEEVTEGAPINESTVIERGNGGTVDGEGGGPVDNNTGNPIEDTDIEDVLEDPTITGFDRTVTFQPGVIETETVTPPGEVTGISVAVIYNGELTPDIEDIIFDQVAAIVGADMERGDEIAIAGIPFNLPQWDEEVVPGGILESLDTVTVLIAVGMLLVLIIGGLIIRKVSRNRNTYDNLEGSSINEIAPYLATEAEETGDIQDDDNLVLEELDLKGIEGQDMIELSGIKKEPEAEKVDVIGLVREVFETRPKKAFEVLKMWMVESKSEGIPNPKYPLALEGIEKAATTLIVLGKDITTTMLKMFSQEEVVQLVHTISNIRTVPRQKATQLMEEFLEKLDTPYYEAEGGYTFAKEALALVMDEEEVESVLRKSKRPFETLTRVDTSQLIKALINEHPQIIALVLCYLPSEKAAQIVAELPINLQPDVIQRIGQMKNTSPEVIEAVESVIEERLHSSVMEEMRSVGGIHTVAEILNTVDRATQKSILETMQETNTEFAAEIQDNLFTFDDIVRVDSTTLQRIIRELDQGTIAMALKGSSELLKNAFMKNISSRAAERLQEELNYLGPVRRVEVEKAQQDIVNVIRKLEDEGEIVITHGGDNDVII